jgi:AraC-type DNA-binding domain-containing proteins
MLCYLGTGPRRYAEHPLPACRRPYWEFQAVLSGRIAMTEETGPGVLRQRRLWLSAPGHLHGWTGEPGRDAEIVVFHFLRLPESLAKRIPDRGHVELSLSSPQARRLRELADGLGRSLQWPGPEMLLRQEHALLELSLLVHDGLSLPEVEQADVAGRRVQKALAWFVAHLEENPGLEDVARMAGSSASHLRRHFHEILGASPKKIFDQLRFQRAMEMMADPAIKLNTVSGACGFESPDAFSRAFKKKFGVSPDHWRGGRDLVKRRLE